MKKILIITLCGVLLLLTACGRTETENVESITGSSSSESEQISNENLQKVSFEEIPENYRQEAKNAGTMETISYQTDDGVKEAYVYLPYGYDESDVETRYEIVYLMHGGGGDIATYFGTPDSPTYLKYAVDHLIEDGRIEPVIVVLPTFYPNGDSDSSVANAASRVVNFPKELRENLIPAVESTYHTYADAVDEAGIKASREHRAFGGFSMGSVTTWYVFHEFLDGVSTFMPSSGDSWLEGVQAGGSASEETAKRLAEGVLESGYGAKDFQIYAATGTEDIAYPMLNPQINAMKELSDVFVFSEEKGQGNLYYNLAEGRSHDWKSAADYFYDGLLFLYGME